MTHGQQEVLEPPAADNNVPIVTQAEPSAPTPKQINSYAVIESADSIPDVGIVPKVEVMDPTLVPPLTPVETPVASTNYIRQTTLLKMNYGANMIHFVNFRAARTNENF